MEIIKLNKFETPSIERVIEKVQSIKIAVYKTGFVEFENMKPTLIISHPHTMRRLFMNIEKENITNQVFDPLAPHENIFVLGCKLKIIESLSVDETEIIIK